MSIFKMDWSLNIGHVISVGVFGMTMVAGWVNLKNEVAVIGERQTHTSEVILEIKENQRENKIELQQEIRDLRNNIIPKVVPSIPNPYSPALSPRTSSSQPAGSTSP